MKKMNFSYTSQPIMTVNNNIRKKLILLSPEFQRGYIWKNEFKDELLVSILSNYPVGNIILSQNNEILEVVDGQQRLTTIINFIGNKEYEYTIRTKNSVEQIKELLKKSFENSEKTLTKQEIEEFNLILKKNYILFRELPEIVRDDFMSYNLNITTLLSEDKKTVVDYFKYVQNQETLKAGEIINSLYIYNTELNILTSSIKNKERLVEFLQFSNKRSDFDKHFLNFVGVLNNKIPLNANAKSIIDFAHSYQSDFENRYVITLIENLNLLIDYFEIENSCLNIKINTRDLKILLSYLSFYKCDFKLFSKIFATLHQIEKNLKNQIEIIDSITFIESRSRNFNEILLSANNLNILINEEFPHD